MTVIVISTFVFIYQQTTLQVFYFFIKLKFIKFLFIVNIHNINRPNNRFCFLICEVLAENINLRYIYLLSLFYNHLKTQTSTIYNKQKIFLIVTCLTFTPKTTQKISFFMF